MCFIIILVFWQQNLSVTIKGIKQIFSMNTCFGAEASGESGERTSSSESEKVAFFMVL